MIEALLPHPWLFSRWEKELPLIPNPSPRKRGELRATCGALIPCTRRVMQSLHTGCR